MSNHSPFSTPDPLAIERHKKLCQHIREEIETAGGFISFARYMELALYTPHLGYYMAGARQFGKSGDFVTAPDISPLFSHCIAKQCQSILAALPKSDILELGAGAGTLAKTLLLELEKSSHLPQHYFIFEISPALREYQYQILKTHCPHLLSRITWLTHLPQSFTGVIFANEVLDALPVHCFQVEAEGIKEKCVTYHDQKFVWQIKAPTAPQFTERLLETRAPEIPGYESEINLMLPEWITALGHSLKEGVILLMDYGYGRREYYHPDRTTGTLQCHYQHRRHADPLIFTGLQDITAHVDFTTVVESAVSAGLTLAGYTTQVSFLLACGLLDNVEESNTVSIEAQYQQNQAIKRLTLPSEMGEVVKVMGLSKNFDAALRGFSLYDRCRDL